jgi:hypothetical protein
MKLQRQFYCKNTWHVYLVDPTIEKLNFVF